MENTLVIKKVFDECGLSEYTDDAAVEKLALLSDMLAEANKVMNLTAITDPHDVALRHFADSITAARFIPDGARVIDVGCGGGFPTLPLAIVRPDIEITALDSTAKKLNFVRDAAEKLSLSVKILPSRAEEAALDPLFREKYDICISRAVARLNILSELCLPFAKAGGSFIAMKGADAGSELTEAENGIKKLGGSVERAEKFTLSEAGERCIIIVNKTGKTPEKYPRAYAKIRKAPL